VSGARRGGRLGIAINPRRTDLIDATKASGSKLPIRTI
jgi:hypothetical protein